MLCQCRGVDALNNFSGKDGNDLTVAVKQNVIEYNSDSFLFQNLSVISSGNVLFYVTNNIRGL